MNFYQHQDRARRCTVLLLLYFAVAVALITAAIDIATFVATRALTDPPRAPLAWLFSASGMWTSVGVVAVIGAGALYTSLQLGGGGKAVAALVGARQVAPASSEPRERQLLNVVEEMSIAAGMPVPALYVIDQEDGINAFVAGTRATATVLVVTRGALAALSRDELQGVVAHEYSHIFNQDMQLNVRLLGLLAGIMLLSRMGRTLMQAGGRNEGKGAAQVALLGFALFAIGYIGVLLGSLIQAAISRQREFLADASAVQFTRNPPGICGALQRIREHASGSRLHNAHADELAHFCFGAAVSHGLADWLATHPPLETRIRAIDPGFSVVRWRAAATSAIRPAAQAVALGSAGQLPVHSALAPITIAASAGTVATLDMRRAERLYGSLPASVLTATRDDPRALVYALLVDATAPATLAVATTLLTRVEGADCVRRVTVLRELIDGLAPGARLPLLNLSLPALKRLATEDRARVIATTRDLINADRQVSVFEFAVQTIVADQLRERGERAVPARHFKFAAVAVELRTLFAVLARAGAQDEASAVRAFTRSFAPFSVGAADLPTGGATSWRSLPAALAELNALSPLLKQSVIRACADCVSTDGSVSPTEAELLQTIALTLDCPLPIELGADAAR